jgi:hypothetical protein
LKPRKNKNKIIPIDYRRFVVKERDVEREREREEAYQDT